MEEKSKIAIIYKSKYGTTKKYAGWIAIKLDADLYEISDITSGDLPDYDTIIFGSSLYAEKIRGINFITRNYEKIKNKNIIVFVVGLSENKNSTIDKVIESNFSEDFSNHVKLFYFRGALDYKNLGLLDKIMIKGLKKVLENKRLEELDEYNKFLLKNFYTVIDFTDKNSVIDIVEYVNNLCAKNE